ncbi:hypothetical protein JQ615_26370 [Bradyrhizobium jicamae]|uniref:Uncharacterized protein n=1 Tax=Bradyrhizobium jicamae TaxID=280332 RepID=A0ABS5FQ31_9BRAD|nr:hypothetical protein [Bradyrhizobium jicamae]MBR0798919.1 hypothetical protein [Bradyrhizobium jicamae]MBR0938619.1 hypothetical protein [Bradyrhizobium jicamae]
MTQSTPDHRIHRSSRASVHDTAVLDYARAAIAHSLDLLKECPADTFLGHQHHKMFATGSLPGGEAECVGPKANHM